LFFFSWYPFSHDKSYWELKKEAKARISPQADETILEQPDSVTAVATAKDSAGQEVKPLEGQSATPAASAPAVPLNSGTPDHPVTPSDAPQPAAAAAALSPAPTSPHSSRPATRESVRFPPENDTTEPYIDANGTLQNGSEELAALLRAERRIPVLKVLFCVGVWVLLVLVSVARGSRTASVSPVGISRCSGGDWGVFSAYIVASILLSLVAGALILRDQAVKDRLHYPYAEGDTKWTWKSAMIAPFICIAAGVLAGLLGVGGALVTSPLLLELGILVTVVTATTSVLLCATSSSSVVQFVSIGLLNWDTGIMFFCMGVVGAIIGVTVILRIATKYKRSSILLISMVILFCVSLVVSLYKGIRALVVMIQHHAPIGFSSPCA
jgi:hypothetical protein